MIWRRLAAFDFSVRSVWMLRKCKQRKSKNSCLTSLISFFFLFFSQRETSIFFFFACVSSLNFIPILKTYSICCVEKLEKMRIYVYVLLRISLRQLIRWFLNRIWEKVFNDVFIVLIKKKNLTNCTVCSFFWYKGDQVLYLLDHNKHHRFDHNNHSSHFHRGFHLSMACFLRSLRLLLMKLWQMIRLILISDFDFICFMKTWSVRIILN